MFQKAILNTRKASENDLLNKASHASTQLSAQKLSQASNSIQIPRKRKDCVVIRPDSPVSIRDQVIGNTSPNLTTDSAAKNEWTQLESTSSLRSIPAPSTLASEGVGLRTISPSPLNHTSSSNLSWDGNNSHKSKLAMPTKVSDPSIEIDRHLEGRNHSSVSIQTAPLCKTPNLPPISPIPVSLLHDQLVHLKKKLHIYKAHIQDSESQLKQLGDRNEILSMKLRAWREFRKYVVQNEKLKPLKEFLDRWIEADPFHRNIGYFASPNGEDQGSPSTPLTPTSPSTPSTFITNSRPQTPSTVLPSIPSRRASFSNANTSGFVSERIFDERELKNNAWTQKLIQQSEIVVDDTKLEQFLKSYHAEYFMLHDMHSSPIGEYYLQAQAETFQKTLMDEEMKEFMQIINAENEKRNNTKEKELLKEANQKIQKQQIEIEKQAQEIKNLKDQLKLLQIQQQAGMRVPHEVTKNPTAFQSSYSRKGSFQFIPLKGEVTEPIPNVISSPPNVPPKQFEISSPQLDKKFVRRNSLLAANYSEVEPHAQAEEVEYTPALGTMIVSSDETKKTKNSKGRRSIQSKRLSVDGKKGRK